MVAEILKQKDCTVAELTEKFQESMAQALERRLIEQTCPAQECNEDRPDCEGELDGRMTPPAGCMTPPETSASAGPDAKIVADKLEQARRGRRSSAVARRSSAVKRDAIQEALNKAVSTHRKSLASKVFEKVEEGSLSSSAEEKINLAMQTTHKRHRLSLSKAAETLDAAGLNDDDEEKTSEQLEMVHKAMEEARRRHRRSVAEAVQKVTGLSATAQPFEPVPGMKAGAEPFEPKQYIQDRIQSAIAAAHVRQFDESHGFESKQPGASSQQTWGQDSSGWTETQSQQFAGDQLHMQGASGYEQSGFGQHANMQSSCDSWQYAQQGCSPQTSMQDCTWQGGAQPAPMYAEQSFGEQTWQGGAQPASMYGQQGYGEQASMQDGAWQGGNQNYCDSYSGNNCYAEGGHGSSQGNYQHYTDYQQNTHSSSAPPGFASKEAQWCQPNTYSQQAWGTEGSGCGQAWPAAWGSA